MMLRLDIIIPLIISAILLKIVTTFTSSNTKHVPGPWYTAFTGLPLKLSALSGRKVYFIHDLHKQYGPIVRISPDTVAVADLESNLKIHKIGSGFQKTMWYSEMTPYDRDGIFAIRDPKDHAAQKKLFSKTFSKTSLRMHWEPTIAEKAMLAMTGIQSEVEKSGEADILKWFTFFATDVAGHLMFGESFKMLEKGQKNRYITVLEKVVKGVAIEVELPLIAPLLKYLPFQATQELFNGKDVLVTYAKKAVQNAKTVGSNRNVFAQMIQEATAGTGTIDDLDVQYEAGNLTVAGSDTTGVSLTYITWLILRDRQLRTALQEEVGTLPNDFDDAALEALPLLNATIEEGLRLYAAAPGPLPRTVPSSGATLAGVFIPGGVTVSTQCWTLHRDPKLFKYPDIFDPYRFLPNQTNPWTEFPSSTTTSAMMPFGMGARTCLGINLAYMELRYGVAYFLRECQWITLSSSATVESMEPENFFLISPKSHQCMVRSEK